MARYYRRRRGWGRRRYFRRRFGAGGGNRKRPSSYAVAYGYTKQFDMIISKYASSFPGTSFSNLYTNTSVLSLCARVFFSTNFDDGDARVLNRLQEEFGPDPQAPLQGGAWDQTISHKKQGFFVFGRELFTGPMRNHAQEDAPAFSFDGLYVPHFEHRQFRPVANSGGNAASTLLVCLKTQLKDSLLKVTKRNLPFALAVSSYILSFLKNKRRRRKYLNFWQWKSVPRFIYLLTYALSPVWKDAKYGPSLLNIMKEVDFVKQTTGTKRLIQLAQAGVEAAQNELGRITSGVSNDINPQGIQRGSNLLQDVIHN